MNPIRKLIQKTGFDFHRYRPKADRGRLWQSLGIKTVLDIGANTGQFAREIREQMKDVQIYSFEPLEDCFQKLVQGFEGDPKFKAFNFALGDQNVETVMHQSGYSPSSSILEMSHKHKDLFPHTKDHTDKNIVIKRLDDIAQDLNLTEEILIKMDVQGFEEKVILGGEEVFKRSKAVIAEVSFVELYSGQPSFDSIYQRLKSLGFEYKGTLEQKIDKESASVISEDLLFVR